MTSELRQHIHWIENMMNEGDIEEALARLQEVALIYPDSYHVSSLIGACYLTLGQPEKAIKPLQWATRRFKKKISRKTPEPRSELEIKEDYDERTTILRIKKAMRRKRKDSLWIDYYLLGCAYGRC